MSKFHKFDITQKSEKHSKMLIYFNIRKDCFQNKSKFITEGHFTKHTNITIRSLNLNEKIINYK